MNWNAISQGRIHLHMQAQKIRTCASHAKLPFWTSLHGLQIVNRPFLFMLDRIFFTRP
jgi:hypothetical protein